MLSQRFILLIIFFLLSFAAKAQPRQGMPAEEIALPTPAGDTATLLSLKGKVVLIDFWASWCRPCRATNKVLAKIYAKYKDKGFEIFSVSIDDNLNAWRKAVSKDKMSWPQVNDNGGKAGTAEAWDIYAIPASFLMDKNGTLVAKDLEGKELERALKQLLDQ
jgi:thiol-disulfide isomerase/thioredoxin